MTLRIPPGRAGRLWLTARIDTARRARDLLDEKRQALLAAERDAAVRAAEAERTWAELSAEARTWLARSAVLDGEAALGLAAAHATEPVEVHVSWRSAMGVRYPDSTAVELPQPPDPRLLAGGSALVETVAAHRRALAAAAAAAGARAAQERLAAELSATARRLRALDVRWLPRHELALAQRELALDEAERAEGIRARWIASRRAQPDG